MKGVRIYNFQRNNHFKNLVLKNDEIMNLKNENLSNKLSNFTRSNSSSNMILKKLTNNNNIYIKESQNEKYEKQNNEKSNRENRIYNNQINYEEKINVLERRISELEEIIKNYEKIFKSKEINSSGIFPFNNITNLNEIYIRLNELENQINSIQNFYKQYINTNSNEDFNINFDVNNFSQLKKIVEQNSNDLKIIIK